MNDRTPHSSPLQNEWLPLESPLPMPVQELREGRLPSRVPPTSPAGIGGRRALVMGVAAMLTIFATYQVWWVLRGDGIDVLEGILLVLFVALFAWIALSFSSALAGFVMLLARRSHPLGIDPDAPLPTLTQRTALLVPTYNEDPWRVLAGVQAMHESLAESGQGDRFDFFILSDTTRPDTQQEELAAVRELLHRLGSGARVFYRRRQKNTERKAGNIAEWVRRFGGAYPHFLILDADSLMTGDTLVRLAAAMERQPALALVQTLPMIVNGRTFFARMQQFAGRVYGPVVAHGIAWWHGAEGNYWGHNAIIRTAAFARHAGLPHLGGGKPFEGAVLSHDFVEAALLRRGGWAVHMAPGLGGSFEEGPPSLTDMLVRDRRWCQGNLQHGAVLPARGLHWISRLHLLVGIGHYFTAPMWAMLMLVGLAIPLQQAGFHLDQPQLAGFTPALYWRGGDPERFLWVFYFTMAVLLAPKVMGCIATMLDPALRRQCGGAARIAGSALLETAMAALMAPVTMYVQSRGVAEVLAGRDSGWETQRRDDGSVALAGLVRRYAGLTLFGLFCGVLAYLVSPALAAWMAPVILGMVLSVPINMVTASPRVGGRLCAAGWFRTPEDTTPPPVLARALELRSRNEGMPSIVEASGTTLSLRSYGPMVGAEDA
ncbi:glucans biosynthesis glucosyltransferase MdoH [Pseudoxanthomonas japonensis]|uniref:Glucans biosynthesis glucosyltransferase H n=1 Tax=Pseudoxanthomonas japonensis TaxID=69284 RepID=A0ABQ6ZH78_9GAMM|nr:glucans biosynthesis glucosyltransferase MdoH [Pseudoxanthomonas japonensis]KAF1725199.1 glucans biosynthesis glucosyltransferase MdoH [Pseudoxanthomonas japonensis]